MICFLDVVALPVSLTLRVSLLQDAGHSHLYAVTWPMLGGAATQKNYSSPMGTIYSEMRKRPLSFWLSQSKASRVSCPLPAVTEGNGAVPGTGPNTTCKDYGTLSNLTRLPSR